MLYKLLALAGGFADAREFDLPISQWVFYADDAIADRRGNLVVDFFKLSMRAQSHSRTDERFDAGQGGRYRKRLHPIVLLTRFDVGIIAFIDGRLDDK